ncbi:HlyD family efflux transporter periplasmic adaptor subunit [Desertifilum sp. FACHB-1129]|uniref:Hemolysin D n=1 Tax=Desertifilum tharense IPPAS B-1220 TaxID=1781255 RepID=A0A1E5QE93_9CYAN|nr:HlyD family efflux transporter periplasmic adaptor subunit [Desertifilum sp. FACHB-1129]MBD2325181.1 HlyD family efflux transporter periplasmic adaptor subunit [Desertifilum sp. FACHB-866]MBD2335263.1 HlyD family efflux transporter periplasmic adaptor subunit [Desertifilum sp. FACHB-868]OEJ72982.1 hemolysin D [Desertifilum tharense IPPAS B-1220]
MVNNSSDSFLNTASADEFLPPISPWITLGGILQIVAVGGAFLLCAAVKYNVIVRVPAVVRPIGEVRLVQAATDGRIEQIQVAENQEVLSGELIATLENSQLKTEKNKLESNIRQSELQLARLAAQIQALDRQIEAETDAIARTVNIAQAELTRQRREYQDRQLNSNAEVAQAQANLRIAEKELEKANADLRSTEANLRSIEAAFNVARLKRDRYQPVAESGALSQNQLEEAQLAVEQQKQAAIAQSALIEAQKQTIERQQQAVEAAEARLQQSLTALNPSRADVEIATERIASQQATGLATQARFRQEQEVLIQQQLDLERQLAIDFSNLQQIELDLQKTAILATTDGTLFNLGLRNPGQVVRAGEAIAQIAPTRAPLTLKARVTTDKIAQVQVCDRPQVTDCQQGKAQLRIAAYPYPDYGTLRGAIRAIAPDITASDGSQSADTYEVTIEAETPYLQKGDRLFPLQPGMDVTADLIAKEETLLTFILRKLRLLTDW